MRPLKEGEPRFPVEADAIELLRSRSRYEPLPGQKQRVTKRLLAVGAPARKARWIGAPLVVALCLCAAGASAAVASGGWVSRGYQALSETFSFGSRSEPSHAKLPARRAFAAKPKAVEATPALPQAPLPATPPSDPNPFEAPQALPAERPLAAPLAKREASPVHGASPAHEASSGREVSPGRNKRESLATATRPAQQRPEGASDVGATSAERAASVAKASPSAREDAARTTRPVAAPESANLVVGAMHALRQEGKPERASKQLDEYMRRYPSGALAEEALALSVEAAVQRNDPRAKELAERYLARYPNGQFRRAAERARALFVK